MWTNDTALTAALISDRRTRLTAPRRPARWNRLRGAVATAGTARPASAAPRPVAAGRC
jgi:hypothetical protein